MKMNIHQEITQIYRCQKWKIIQNHYKNLKNHKTRSLVNFKMQVHYSVKIYLSMTKELKLFKKNLSPWMMIKSSNQLLINSQIN